MAIRFFGALVAEILHDVVGLFSSDVDAVVVEPFVARLALDVTLVRIERTVAHAVLRPLARRRRKSACVYFIGRSDSEESYLQKNMFSSMLLRASYSSKVSTVMFFEVTTRRLTYSKWSVGNSSRSLMYLKKRSSFLEILYLV